MEKNDYFFLPPDLLTCVNADAAADFSALVDLGSARTFPAAEAAFGPVLSFLLLNAITSLRSAARHSSVIRNRPARAILFCRA